MGVVTPVTELFANPWMRVTLDESRRLVRIERTPERLTAAGLASLAPIGREQLPPARRARLRLLFDTRLAPLLADERTEDRIGSSSHRLFDGFERAAVLVGTAVGRLQASRFNRLYSRLYSSPVSVFDDEPAALAYLLG